MSNTFLRIKALVMALIAFTLSAFLVSCNEGDSLQADVSLHTSTPTQTVTPAKTDPYVVTGTPLNENTPTPSPYDTGSNIPTPDNTNKPYTPKQLDKTEGLPLSWTKLKEVQRDVMDQKQVTVILGQPSNTEEKGTISAFIKSGSSYYYVGDVCGYGVDDVNIWSQDITGNGINEVIISGPMGATYVKKKVIGYDTTSGGWLELLTSGYFEANDIDSDGKMELVETSTGSVPSYVIIYRWNNDHFESLNVTEATGNTYAIIHPWPLFFIESGDGVPIKKSQYYYYDKGKLVLLKESISDRLKYILPDSNKIMMTESHLNDLYTEQIDLARNEIYARHGYVFTKSEYKEYFMSKSWYNPDPSFSMEKLSDIEKKNAEFLKNYKERSFEKLILLESSNLSLDLNGDSIKENISFSCKQGSDTFTLVVNNTKFEGTGYNLDGEIYICDIDKSDRYKELAVTESGPSSDYATEFFLYDGKNLVSMGKIEGDAYFIKILENGTVVTQTRGRILQTWFYSDVYKLSNNHKLINVPKDLYKMNTFVRLKKPLNVKKSRESDETFKIPQGEIAVILRTDNKEWCEIMDSNGRIGWFALENYGHLKGTEMDTSEVFDGLCYAD